MTRLLPIAFAALLSAPASAQLYLRLPELGAAGEGSNGTCGVQAFSRTVLVPSVAQSTDTRVPEDWRKFTRDTEQTARLRLVSTRLRLNAIHLAADDVVSATQQCGDSIWEKLDALSAAADGAARDEVTPSFLNFDRAGQEVRWVPMSIDPFEKSLKGAPALHDRYADACRAPAADIDLLAPDAPGLPGPVRAKLAPISVVAGKTSSALRAQKASLDELLRLTNGRRCREILAAYDALVAVERDFFFSYRQQAVAAAVWDQLEWSKRTAPK